MTYTILISDDLVDTIATHFDEYAELCESNTRWSTLSPSQQQTLVQKVLIEAVDQSSDEGNLFEDYIEEEEMYLW